MLALAITTILGASSLVILRFISNRGWNQVQQQVAAVVKLEEELALAGDIEAVLALQDPANQSWRAVRATLTSRRLPVPVLLPELTPAGEALVVRSITALDRDVVSADVERKFNGSEGSSLTFHGPQFYRRTQQNGWIRIAPPQRFWGRPASWRNSNLHLLYFSPDEEAVAVLGPALTQKLSDACARLALHCAPALPVSLWFGNDAEYSLPTPWEARLVNLSIVNVTPAAGEITQGETFLAVGSLQFGQLPANEAAREALTAHFTAQAVRFLSQKLYGNTPQAQELFRQMLFMDGGILPGQGGPVPFSASGPFSQASSGSTRDLQPETAGLPAGTLVSYNVVAGDTLWAIAARFRSAIPAIVEENKLTDPDQIQPGQELRVPVNLLAP